MPDQIQTALLAYGMSGKVFHAPFLTAHQGFSLNAVLERHQKNASADYPEVRSFNRLEDLLADPLIELVVVNTPNNLHYEQAKAALEAGKHVLVEKPVCTRPEELEHLFALADKKGKQVLFYQNRRWDSDYQNLIAAIHTKDFGHIHEAHFRFDRYNLTLSPKTFKETPVDASGIQYDLIPHVLDQAIALFGVPEKFYKRLSRLRPDTRVDDFCSIQLSYPDLEVYVVASLVTAYLPPAFRIYGREGCYEKRRSDVQEDQLKAGLRPTDPRYGEPAAEMAGTGFIRNSNNELNQLSIQEEPSNYLGLFEAVYQTIRSGMVYPVTREQMRAQIQILAAPEN